MDGKRLVDLLVVDDMENVARRLRTLVPEGVSLDGVLTAQGAVANCKERLYRVVLVDNDLPDVSSSSLIKPLRMLQPQAAFIALALRSNNKVQDEARDMGFDGVLFKPFDSANIADLLGRYFENNDLVTKEENILRVLSFRGRDSGLDRYFNQISKLILASVESIADACFGEVILDTTQMPVVPGKIPRLIVAVGDRSKQMGLQLRLVGSSDMAKTLKQVADTTNVPFFTSLEDAQRFEAA
jgi:CheY-like chemotaxis protein